MKIGHSGFGFCDCEFGHVVDKQTASCQRNMPAFFKQIELYDFLFPNLHQDDCSSSQNDISSVCGFQVKQDLKPYVSLYFPSIINEHTTMVLLKYPTFS